MNSPKYREISERLGQDIVNGKYQPGQRFPSEAALVKRFGVSRITIGHALRELQKQALIDRVAGSGTFVRPTLAGRREGLLFGLVIPNLGETEIFEPICQGIASAPDAAGHALLWPQGDSGALRLAEQCIERHVSGVFFAPLEHAAESDEVNRRVMALLKKARMPVVLLDRRPADEPDRGRFDLVGIDNHRAGFLATEHLKKRGARLIGFVAYRGQVITVQERMRGYRDALRLAGAEFLVTPETERLPPELALCDGLVCANDRIAGHLMHLLQAAGRRIPEDVRIVGIDDVTYAALLPVPLTTVQQPCRDIGETALQVMLERLDRPRMPARDVLLDCALVIRQSCGTPIPSSVGHMS